MDNFFDIPINLNISEGQRGLKGDRGATGRPGLKGKDGRDGKNGLDGRDGVDGKDGKDGKDGRDGRDGKDGDVIDFNASINEEGELIISKSTGEELNLGLVKGENGNAGNVWGYTNLTAVSPLVMPEPHDFISLDMDALVPLINGLTVSNFASPNISQWTNDSGYLTSATVVSGISDGAVLYVDGGVITGDVANFSYNALSHSVNIGGTLTSNKLFVEGGADGIVPLGFDVVGVIQENSSNIDPNLGGLCISNRGSGDAILSWMDANDNSKMWSSGVDQTDYSWHLTYGGVAFGGAGDAIRVGDDLSTHFYGDVDVDGNLTTNVTSTRVMYSAGGIITGDSSFTFNQSALVLFVPDLQIQGAAVINTDDGLDINPGSDINVDVLTVNVTGTPKLQWIEASNIFGFSVGLSISNGDLTLNNACDLIVTNGDATFGGLVTALNSGNGFYVDPGGDTDFIFVNGNVTGQPGMYWDESANSIGFTHPVFSEYSSTSSIISYFKNTSNANTAAHSYLQVVSGGSSGGDAVLCLTVPGVLDWTIGIDNSDSDKLKIGRSFTVGTDTRVAIDNDFARFSLSNATNAGIEIENVSTGNPQVRFMESGAQQAALTWLKSTDILAIYDGTRDVVNVIESSGSVGIRTTTVDANYILQLPNSSSQKAKANAWDTYSDGRLKENLITISDTQGLAVVQGLNPCFYNWKQAALTRHDTRDGEDIPHRPQDLQRILAEAGVVHAGFIAQEVAQVCEYAVGRDNEGIATSVNDYALTPFIVAALKNIDARLSAIELIT